VTAVIGFCVNDSVILATDSQMTDTVTETKECDFKKIARIQFKDGHSALIARAGVISTADLFQEHFEQLAGASEVTDWRTIANVAEAAIKQARQKMMDGFHHRDLKKGEMQAYLAGELCTILLAYVFQRQPYIFVFDSIGANPIKQTHPFVALGSGSLIARSILQGFEFNSLKEYEAVGLAFYTIEMCKRTDLYCSGPVQVARADQRGCWIYGQQFTNEMEEAVRKTYATSRAALAKQISINFNEIPLNL
jgi:20S proteasome alpha/beta subunit